MHILSPETDNCPSCISGRERMTIENISCSISTKECCRPRRGLNPQPPGLQSDGASNWATEAILYAIYTKIQPYSFLGSGVVFLSVFFLPYMGMVAILFNGLFVCVNILRPSHPMGSCRVWSVYLTILLLGRLSPLWAWWPSCSMVQSHLNKLSIPLW